MKISVIMIDGGFRDNVFGAKYFTTQNLPDNDYEVIWVDYFDKINKEISSNPKIKTILLQKIGIYHSSYCFNKGIQEAQGEIIVIPDADQIVAPDFLSNIWELHKKYEKLVAYGYRYDEPHEGILTSYSIEELDKKCVLKNRHNYGACLTVRKKWLLAMNGYEQHDIFRTGFHANGLLMATRFKNMGLAIQWDPLLKLYHPWHPFTLSEALEYKSQHRVIDWFKLNNQWHAINGINPELNLNSPADLDNILKEELETLNTAIMHQWDINSMAEFNKNTTQPLLSYKNLKPRQNRAANIFRKLFKNIKRNNHRH